DRHREEHRVRQRDREQRVAGDARQVVQAVCVDRVRGAPHPPEGEDHRTLERADDAEEREPPDRDSLRGAGGAPHLVAYARRRSRRSSCAPFALPAPPVFAMTCPIRAPITASLPARNFSTSSGFAASTSST